MSETQTRTRKKAEPVGEARNEPNTTTDVRDIVEVANGQERAIDVVEAKPKRAYPNLASALSAAQAKCGSAVKNKAGQKGGGRFMYAPAEEVFAVAKEALADTGIAVLPLAFSCDGHSKTGEDRYELSRQFLVMHGNETIAIPWNWPVIEEKGRDLGVACAIAATLSEEYFYRALLNMPRVSAAMAQAATTPEVEEAEEPAPAPTAKPARRKKDREVASAQLIDRIDELLQQKGITMEQWQASLAKRHVENAEELTPDQAAEIIGLLEKMPDPATADASA